MCLARVFQGKETDQPVLENIAYMRLDGDQVQLETLFGETMVLQGKLRQVDFVKSRVVVEE